jgi:hypothetical protein
MLQRLTLIVRLQHDPVAQDWYGQVEMVNPHRLATFRDRHELWALLEDWTNTPNSAASPTQTLTPPAKQRTRNNQPGT